MPKKEFMPITMLCSKCDNKKEIKIDVKKYGDKTVKESLKDEGLDNWLCEKCRK